MSNDEPFRQKTPSFLALAAVCMVVGCAVDYTDSNRNSEIGLRDASATMRVEVEVYKGPLSKEPAIQLAELEGIVDDSQRALEILLGNMDYSRRQMKCEMLPVCKKAQDPQEGCIPSAVDKATKKAEDEKRSTIAKVTKRAERKRQSTIARATKRVERKRRSTIAEASKRAREERLSKFSEIDEQGGNSSEVARNKRKARKEEQDAIAKAAKEAEEVKQDEIVAAKMEAEAVERAEVADAARKAEEKRMATIADTIPEARRKDSDRVIRTINKKIKAASKDEGNGPYQFRFTFERDDKDSRDATQACNSLRQLFSDVVQGQDKCFDATRVFSENNPGELAKKCGFRVPQNKRTDQGLDACERRLAKIATFGAFLKRRAAYWAAEHVATSPSKTRLRIEMANFMQFAAEYGNQITSRADALLKQSSGAGGMAILRGQLPNSTYLRDSEPTAYLNLYDWNEAAVKGDRKTTSAERIRIVEHLVADNYWSHINTVFAAGQGDVSMALVKDDVGNWNLKSFDNSPGQLLGAYKELGLAAVRTTAELAGSVSGLPRAKNALNFANQIALGSTSGDRAEETDRRLAVLRKEAARQIKEVGKDQGELEAHLTGAIADLNKQIDGGEGADPGLERRFEDAASDLAAKKVDTATTGTDITMREQKIMVLQAEVAAITVQRDAAVSRRTALQSAESDGTSDVEGDVAAPKSNASEVAALIDRIGSLNDLITEKSKELSKILEEQSMALKELKVAEAEQSRLQESSRLGKGKTGCRGCVVGRAEDPERQSGERDGRTDSTGPRSARWDR